MCEQGETIYNAGEVVWVKMGSVWWPAEVMDQEKLSPDVIPAFKKPPIAIVKFFQEDMYEYIKKNNAIFKYQCAKKNAFIKKGLDMYRAKQVHMEKFPEDVIRAERATGGDTEILTRDEFQEVKRERHSGVFGEATKTPSAKKGQGGKSKMMEVTKFDTFSKMKKTNVEYKVKILVQGSKSPSTPTSASTSRADTCSLPGESTTTEDPVKPAPVTPTATTTPGLYSCHSCAFTTSRLNTMIMHNKSHSVTAPFYVPSPVSKNHKTIMPTKPQKKKIINTTKPPKIRKPKKAKVTDTPKRKRAAEEQLSESIEKKSKTDEEIKSSLLADWDDEWADEEQKPLTDAPETPEVVESQLPLDPVIPESDSTDDIEIPKDAQNGESLDEKPVKDSRYEFCEEEDWPLETDVGRKIPRIKNLPKQKTDSRVIDEETVAREVSDLLDKTTLPELPSVPEPLKVEANFPEPSVVKSPDKKIFVSKECSKSPSKIEETQGKTIFKTKTFFRSRHSRSQDAIEKYIAEQLNATEKIDSLDSDMNGSDVTSSPDGRESPTVEPVKVVRLAPKIQLKKMKAESQLKEMSLLKLKNDDNQILTICTVTNATSDCNNHQLPATNIGGNELAHSQQQILDNVQVTADLNSNNESSNSKIDQELADIQEIVLDHVPTSVDLNVVKSDYVSDTGEELSNIQGHVLNAQTSVKLKATESDSFVKDKVPQGTQESSEHTHENILDNVHVDTNNVHTTNLNVVESRSDIKTCEGLLEMQEIILDNLKDEAGANSVNRGYITYTGKKMVNDQKQTSDNVQAAVDLTIIDSIDGEQSNLKEQISTKVQASANFNTIVNPVKTCEELSDIQELIGNVQSSVDLNTADNNIVPDTVEELLKVESAQADAGSTISAIHELPGGQVILDKIEANSVLNVFDGESSVNADKKLSVDQEIVDGVQAGADLNVFDGYSTVNVDKELSVDQEILDKVQASEVMNVIDRGFSIKADIKLSGDQEQILDNEQAASDMGVVERSSTLNVDYKLSSDQEHISDNIHPVVDCSIVDSIREDQLFDKNPILSELHTSLNLNIIDSGTITSTVDFNVHNKKQVPANLKTYEDHNFENKSLLIKKTNSENEIKKSECHVTETPTPDDSNEDLLRTEKCNIITNDKNVLKEVEITKHTDRKDNMSFKVNNGDDMPTDINNMKNNLLNSDMLQNYTKQSNPISGHVTSTVHELLCAALDSDRVPKSVSNDLPEDLFEEDVKGDNVNEYVTVNGEVPTNGEYSEISHEGECVIEEVVTSEDMSDSLIEIDTISNNDVTVLQNKQNVLPLQDNAPSESDLQVAEALITLPSTHSTELKNIEVVPSDSHSRNNVFQVEDKHSQLILTEETVSIQTSSVPNNTIHKEQDQVTKSFFETEKEKSENLNAAQLLVEMSETVDHKVVKLEDHDNVGSFMTVVNHTTTSPAGSYVNVRSDSLQNKVSAKSDKKKILGTKPTSKLLQVLEKPLVSRPTINKTPSKTIRVTSNEKIINFEVNKLLGGTPSSSSQKILVRKPANKILNPSKETLVLSRNKSQEGSSVQTYTIQTTPEPIPEMNIIMQQRLKNISKPPPKIQKIKPVSTILGKAQDLKIINNCKNDSTLFDINSMPVVLSDDIVTPENIEKLPIVMSDGNIIKNPARTQKVTSIIKHVEKVPTIKSAPIKPEVKSIRLNQVTATEPNIKSPTPNILSKSTKVRNTKQMIIYDKSTGKQTMVVPELSSKNIAASTNITSGQQVKAEKYIVLQKASKPVRQKIVIDPKSGKAHVILPKAPEAESTPVSAKLVSSVTNTGTSGTVMIITNAQGSQSRIVLTSEHEKILFPNNQHLNLAQLKTVVPQRPVGRVSQTIISPVVSKPPKLVPKEKTIITSKGQLIVGGRLTTTQTIAPKPEVRPTRRFITVDPSKPTPQRSSSEPLIFLQQKSGSIMQLTQSQFENLQRSGQLFKKPTAQPVIKDNKIVVQKSVTLNPSESIVPVGPKQRARAVRSSPAESPMPKKKPRLEPVIATVPARAQYDPSPALDNFEELLPSTAIARQTESMPVVIADPEPAPVPESAPCLASASPFAPMQSPAVTEPPETVPSALNDGNLLAVPGEHFGGPAGSFYLCIEDGGMFTPLDNRPLVLENNQLVPMGGEAVSAVVAQPERRDILEAALANSDVFRADATRDEAPDFRDLNANVSVHCRVSETSSTLHQPIMSPQELPSTVASAPPPAVPSLEAGLAVIGVTPHTVPTSLELPITVTDPRIAPRAPDPLSFGAPISMPLLTDEDDSVGKSMPILTDDTVASIA